MIHAKKKRIHLKIIVYILLFFPFLSFGQENQNEIEPKGIIIHAMAEYVRTSNGSLYAKDFLNSNKLSVHGLIKPDGTYDKMLPSQNKAFHAGKSYHEPYNGLNSYYIGIEILVKGEHDFNSFSKAIETEGTFTEEQFNCCLEKCKFWMEKYNINIERVVRHSDVSGDHIRGVGKGKTDPGSAFDWNRFIKELCN